MGLRLTFKIFVKNRLKKFVGYIVQKLTKIGSFESLLYRRLDETEDFFFIQIGANDGVSFDRIFPFVTSNKLKGIVVEPLRDMFDMLTYNYRKHPQVKKINVAIHNTEKSMNIYRVDPKAPNLPNWTQGIASFNKDHHKKSKISEVNIITEKVICMSFEDLIKENNVTKIDLLQIDTEGYDYEIIKMINFDNIKPHIIRFEHGIKSDVMSREDFKKCMNYLFDQGYFIQMEDYDAIAYLS
jgi:FkbM family methyltransferase